MQGVFGRNFFTTVDCGALRIWGRSWERAKKNGKVNGKYWEFTVLCIDNNLVIIYSYTL